MKKKNFLFSLSILVQQLLAQESPIITDRPSFTTGTYTVKPRNLVVEFGYQHAFNNNGIDSSTQTAPQLATRIGLTDKAELDILWGGWVTQQTENQPSVASTSDLALAGKYRLIKNGNYNLTLLAILSFPTGSRPSTSEHIDPTMGLLWDHVLSSNVSAFGTLQANSFILEEKRVYDFQPAIGLSFSHTKKITTFIEYYSTIPLRSEKSNQKTFDGGMTYLINNNLQWDINFGIGLNTLSDDYLGTGFGFRF